MITIMESLPILLLGSRSSGSISIIVSQCEWDFLLLELLPILREGGRSSRLVAEVGVDEGQ